eukprot:Lithocolla_globosa_v1_NODE_5623_length_1209_cov_4.896014.p2 type:complete len:122 gc:universal NODE_5623_length_1209_cov_4.896014:232-597(+)
MILSIKADSPGNRNSSRNILRASSNPCPAKSNKLVKDSNNGNLLRSLRYSPSNFLSKIGVDFKNLAIFGISEVKTILCFSKNLRPSFGLLLNFSQPSRRCILESFLSFSSSEVGAPPIGGM